MPTSHKIFRAAAWTAMFASPVAAIGFIKLAYDWTTVGYGLHPLICGLAIGVLFICAFGLSEILCRLESDSTHSINPETQPTNQE